MKERKRKDCILLRIYFSSQEKQILAITPPKHMQTLYLIDYVCLNLKKREYLYTNVPLIHLT